MDGVWDGTLIPCITSAGVRTQLVKALNYEYVDCAYLLCQTWECSTVSETLG